MLTTTDLCATRRSSTSPQCPTRVLLFLAITPRRSRRVGAWSRSISMVLITLIAPITRRMGAGTTEHFDGNVPPARTAQPCGDHPPIAERSVVTLALDSLGSRREASTPISALVSNV